MPFPSGDREQWEGWQRNKGIVWLAFALPGEASGSELFLLLRCWQPQWDTLGLSLSAALSFGSCVNVRQKAVLGKLVRYIMKI